MEHEDRLLTVQDTQTRYHCDPIATIRLRGMWLGHAGFEPGDKVRVSVTAGKLVIERRENDGKAG